MMLKLINITKKFFIILISLNLFSCYLDKELNLEKSYEEKLCKIVKRYVNKYNYICGLSVSVYDGNTEEIYSYATGLQSVDNNVENSIFSDHFLFSITKSFIAAGIIGLVDEGRLQLDDSISKYLDNIDRIYINPDATIEELLCHKSGIYDYTNNPGIFYNNPFTINSWKPEEILSLIREPCSERGGFNYSSSNYILLGLILEKITGIPLNQYIHEEFIDCFDLNIKISPQDFVDYSSVIHPHIYPETKPLYLVGDGKTPIDCVSVFSNILEMTGKCSWSAGGFIGNSIDIVKWCYQLLSINGGVKENIRFKILDSVSSFKDDTFQEEAYGYGIRKIFYSDTFFIGSYGRGIGDENLMYYNPEKDVGICILSSSNMRKDGTPNIDELMFSIYEEFYN